MKAKLFAFALLLSLALMSFSSKTGKMISLNHKWTKGKQTRSISVSATLNDSKELQLFFYRNLGKLQIEVNNESGETIYSDVIDTDISSELMIPLVNEESGRYFLIMSNQEHMITGDFALE